MSEGRYDAFRLWQLLNRHIDGEAYCSIANNIPKDRRGSGGDTSSCLIDDISTRYHCHVCSIAAAMKKPFCAEGSGVMLVVVVYHDIYQIFTLVDINTTLCSSFLLACLTFFRTYGRQKFDKGYI